MQGIAWMSFVIILVLGMMSPTSNQSFDQGARNQARQTELRLERMNQMTQPMGGPNEALTHFANALKPAAGKHRDPSSALKITP